MLYLLDVLIVSIKLLPLVMVIFMKTNYKKMLMVVVIMKVAMVTMMIMTTTVALMVTYYDLHIWL